MNKLIENVQDVIVTSNEVLDILGINRSRLSQLKKSNKLVPIKKNIYLLESVLERKHVQEKLREKYYKKRKNQNGD